MKTRFPTVSGGSYKEENGKYCVDTMVVECNWRWQSKHAGSDCFSYVYLWAGKNIWDDTPVFVSTVCVSL